MENSIEIIKFNLNYVYQELIDEFISNKGKCNNLTYNLISWDYILKSNNCIHEVLDTKSINKLYISYVINLFSKYLKESEPDLLIDLLSVLKDQNLFQHSITTDLKKICLKKIASMVSKPNSNEFRDILKNQDLIYNFENYRHYSNQNLVDEVCNILKKLKQSDDKSLLKTILNIPTKNTERDISISLKDHFERPLVDKNLKLNLQIKSTSSKQIVNYDHNYCIENFNRQIKAEETIPDKEPMEEENVYGLRERNGNRSYFFGFDNSKSSFGDENNDDEYHSEESQSNTDDDNQEVADDSHIRWTEEECVRLIYIVDRIGKRWSTIAHLYKNHFKNRNLKKIETKYRSLRLSNSIGDLRKKAELVNDVKIIKTTHKKEPVRWSTEELTYLVFGVQKYGTKWKKIRQVYKNHFNKNRLCFDFYMRYFDLRKNPKKFEFYQKQAELLKTNKKLFKNLNKH